MTASAYSGAGSDQFAYPIALSLLAGSSGWYADSAMPSGPNSSASRNSP
jgi:hypothetical protein